MSARGKVKWTFTLLFQLPYAWNTSRTSSNDSGYKVGSWTLQPLLPSSWQNESQRTLVTALVAVTQKMLGNSSVEQIQRLLSVSASPALPWGHLWCCAQPSPTFLSACAPESYAQSCDLAGKCFPPPCHPPAWAEHWAVLTTMPWWHSWAPAREEGASESAPDDPGKHFLGCWVWFLDNLRTIVFALLSKHFPDHILELMCHFVLDQGTFPFCQVVTFTAWQSPVKLFSLGVLYKSKELAAT